MISVIIPFYNEEKNLPILHEELVNALNKLKRQYEIILVDDGSDESPKLSMGEIKVLNHRTRMGKGEALATGVKNATGDILVFMDADLQDDPKYLKEFIDKIDQGYDFVNGWRTNRKHSLLIKIYSRIFNNFLKKIMRSPFHDMNCGFKMMKKEVFEEIVLYGNNFRLLPLKAFYKGFKVAEVPLENRVRRFGVSKFGTGKALIGLFDTITAYFIYKYSENPLHFFGIVGFFFFIIGFLISLVLSVQRIFYGELLYRRPALLFAVAMIIVGIQIFLTGIIGELIVYYNKKNK